MVDSGDTRAGPAHLDELVAIFDDPSGEPERFEDNSVSRSQTVGLLPRHAALSSSRWFDAIIPGPAGKRTVVIRLVPLRFAGNLRAACRLCTYSSARPFGRRSETAPILG